MISDLMGQLWKPEFEVDDFVTVIMAHYGRSSGSVERDNFGDQDSPSLILEWGKKGTISALRPGPGFESADIDLLRSKLESALSQSQPSVRRFVVTTLRPLTGALAFRDWFTLIPAPPEAPRPTQDYAGGHPAIIEVAVNGSTDGMITFRRAQRSLFELEAIFGAVLQDEIKRPTPSSRHLWILDPSDHRRSIFSQPNYQIPDFVGSAETFTDIAPMADIALVPADDYYARRWVGENVLRVPDTLPSLLLRFRNLDVDRKRKFLRGAYWAKVAPELWHTSQSAAYAATVRAIEALMPTAPLSEQCDACGGGPVRQMRKAFAQFVDDLNGGGLSEKQRLAFYDRRSRLVHGDQVLSWDQDIMGNTGPRHLEEMGDQHMLAQISQIVFHNWLISQPIPIAEAG
jgi:hypothetical protein